MKRIAGGNGLAAGRPCSEWKALRDSLETIETDIYYLGMAADVQLDAGSGMIHTSANVAERDGLIKGHSADGKRPSQRK